MPESENGYLKSQVSSPRMCGIHLEFRHIAEEELQSFKFTIELQDKNGFDALEQEVKQKLQREGKTSDQHRLYIRHGLYSVGYANGFVLETCCLDKADDWTSCMAMRKKVDDLKPGQAVKIAIHIEYSAIPSFCRTQSGPSAREFCDDLIHKKLLKSNRDENYLPHVDLSAIVASNNIVRLIINDEAPRDWEDARRDQLDRTVLEEGRQMFATCVRANEPIVHLEEILVKEKINDLAMQRRDEEDIILGDSAKLNRLYEAHWLFYPLHFGEDERGKYLHGHNESVHKFKRLPIAVGKNLGRGASGEVRAARIEGSQHRCHTV